MEDTEKWRTGKLINDIADHLRGDAATWMQLSHKAKEEADNDELMLRKLRNFQKEILGYGEA